MTTDYIPGSYYLMAVGDTRKLGTRSNSALKIQEKQIIWEQDPVGWMFFAYANVDRLIKSLSQSFGNVDYALIAPDMLRIYHMDPVAGHVPLSELSPDRLLQEVERMDRQLEKLTTQNLLHLSAANQRYVGFVRDGMVGFERHGEWTRSTRRETIPNPATDLLAQQEGFVFTPKTQDSTVMPPSVPTAFADYPANVLAQQKQTRLQWQ